MRFDQRLDLSMIPEVVKSVYSIARYSLWNKRVSALKTQMENNTFLQEYFEQRLPLELSFDYVHRYHKATGKYPSIDDRCYELYSFFAQLTLVYERLFQVGRERLRATIRDGLQDHKGLGPVAAELRTAGHLMSQGFDVVFTDLEGLARYDFLVSKNQIEIEIDCKAPSGDVGRQIHQLRFRIIAGQISRGLSQLSNAGGGWLVTLRISSNLHGNKTFEAELVKEAAAAIQRGNAIEVLATRVELRVNRFDLNRSPFLGDQLREEDLASFLRTSLDLDTPNAIAMWQPTRSAVVFAMTSRKPDRVVDGLYRQLKESAENQFSHTRAAVLCVNLRDVSGAQLRALAEEPTNGLAAIATRLMSGTARRHLAGMSFVSLARSVATRSYVFGDVSRTTYQDMGAAYIFSNPENCMAQEVASMFR